jgi:O-acetylhomoserine (thiol)-lyase
LCLHAGSSRRGHRRARAADLSDDIVRVRQRRPRGEPFQPADLRQRLLAHLEPTVAALEERIAALEGGRAALAAATGWRRKCWPAHAVPERRSHRRRAGALRRHVFAVRHDVRPFGIGVSFVDADDPPRSAPRCTPKTKALYAETLGNPQLNVCDIAALSAVGARSRRPLVIDNTMASPFLAAVRARRRHRRPFADEIPGGHGTTMGGIVVESGKFPWDNGKFRK